MNIEYRADRGILAVEPSGPLGRGDFETLAAEIAGIKAQGRALNGLLIHTRTFPGYERFSDLLAHAEFVKEHGDEIGKVALCTDTPVAKLLALIGQTFVHATVKKFDFDQLSDAERWLSS